MRIIYIQYWCLPVKGSLDVVGDFLRGDVGDVPLCEAQVSTSPNFFARSS